MTIGNYFEVYSGSKEVARGLQETFVRISAWGFVSVMKSETSTSDRLYLLICASSSSIFVVFCAFFGFGLRGNVSSGFTTSSLPNQSDISDRLAKSLSNSSCTIRAIPVVRTSASSHSKLHLPARCALWSSYSGCACGGTPDWSPNALVAHQVRSWRILRGSGRPSLSICL